MFKFEENEDDSDASDDDLPISGFDDDEDEKSDKSDDEIITPSSRWENQKPPKIINMASSVPVAIPQAFANFQRKTPNEFEPSKPRASNNVRFFLFNLFSLFIFNFYFKLNINYFI